MTFVYSTIRVPVLPAGLSVEWYLYAGADWLSSSVSRRVARSHLFLDSCFHISLNRSPPPPPPRYPDHLLTIADITNTITTTIIVTIYHRTVLNSILKTRFCILRAFLLLLTNNKIYGKLFLLQEA